MIDTETVLNSDFQGGCSNCTYGNGQIKELSYCPYCWVENQGPTVNVLSTHPPTIAFDLDGTLATYDGWKGEDHFGSMRMDHDGYSSSDALKELKDQGHRIIIWTTRGNKDKIKDWLESNDIPYDHINENPNQPPGSSQKIIADLYPDDRAIDARKPLREIVDEIKDRLSRLTQNGEQEYGVADYKKKPDNCTCNYPDIVFRNGSGHDTSCLCHKEYLRKRYSDRLLNDGSDGNPVTVLSENTSSQEAVLRAKLATMEAQAATAKTPGMGEKVYHEGQYVLSPRGKAHEHSGLAFSRHRVGAFSWAAKHHYTTYKSHLEASQDAGKETPFHLSAAAKHYRAYEANQLASRLTERLTTHQRRELVENVWNEDEETVENVEIDPNFKPDEEGGEEGFWFGNKDIGGGHSVQLIKDQSEMYPGTHSYHFNHTVPGGKTLYGEEATEGFNLKPYHVANAIANLLVYSLQKHQPRMVSIKSTASTPELSAKKLNIYHRVLSQIADRIPYKIDRRPSDIRLTRKTTENVEIDPNFEPDEEYDRPNGDWTGVSHLPGGHIVEMSALGERPTEYKFEHYLPNGILLTGREDTSSMTTKPHHVINAVANLFRYSLMKHKPNHVAFGAIGSTNDTATKKADIYEKALSKISSGIPYEIKRDGNVLRLRRRSEVANYNPSNPRDVRGKWNEGDQIKVEIKGKPYNLTKVADGWHVVALEQKTDRLHKNYVVGTNEQGLARECSCPDFVYRGGCCKHMSAVNGLESGSETGESPTNTTENIESDEIGHELEHGELYTARVNPESGNAGTSYRINTKSDPETGRSGVSGIYKPVGRGFINKSLENHFPIPSDSQHIREVAAYVVAKHLGMEDMVPRTVFRRGHLNLLRALKDPNNKEMYNKLFVNSGKPENKFYIEHSHHVPGSMQHFIKSGLAPTNPAVPPHFMYGSSLRDIHRAAAFDYIIGNMDRNITNWMLQKGMRRNPYKKGEMEARYDLKLNDHGYSFPSKYTGSVSILGSNEGFSDIKDHAYRMKIPDEIYQYRDKWPAIQKDLEAIQDHEGKKLDKPAIERAAHRFDLITSGAYERYGHLPNNKQLAAHHLDPENE